MGSTQNSGVEEEVESLRRALNGLRREHRELKEEVEEKVLGYLEEEKAVIGEIDDRVGDMGYLIGEIKKNRDRVKELEREIGSKADTEEMRERLDELEERVEKKDRDLVERVKKLETRMDTHSDSLE